MGKGVNGVNTGTGGISILAIFVVLCLTTLATLSLVSAKADLALAEKTRQSAEQYYEADAIAEEFAVSVMRAAGTGENYTELLTDAGYEVNVSGDTALVVYDIPIDEIRSLHVELELALNGGTPTGEWSRTCWETRVAEDTEEDQTLTLLSGVEVN